MSTLNHIWSTITEIDIKGLRQQVQTPLEVAILGSDIEGVHWLHDALRTDPFTQVVQSLPHTLWVYHLPADEEVYLSASSFDLALVVWPDAEGASSLAYQAIQNLKQNNPHLPIVRVSFLLYEPTAETVTPDVWLQGAPLVVINRFASDPFDAELATALLKLLPDEHVALAYHLPGLRPSITHRLIRETSIANAGYSASTGIAELVPVLFLPVNVADMIVLSKNQALMSYKLALALGKDIGIQEMAVELAGVLGSGFLWREIARTLVGLIPGWGILPKVAISYAGTFVVGQAVFHWYAHGRQLSRARIRELYQEALQEGRAWAADHLPKERPQINLPALPRPRWRRSPGRCPHCHHRLRRHDIFCAKCGTPVVISANALESGE